MSRATGRFAAALAVAALAVPVVCGAPAAAAPIRVSAVHVDDGSDLSARKKRVDDALATANATYEAAGGKVQAAAAAYAAATASMPDAQSQLAVADGAVISASVDLDHATTAVTTAQATAASARDAVSAADAQVDSARAAIATMASAAYEGAGLVDLNVLMNPGSPGDVLDRLSTLDQMAVTQHRALGGYVAARMRATDAYNQAAAARQAADTARAAATAALTRSQAAKAAAQTDANTLAALVAARQAALAVAEKYRAATLKQYEELQKESDQVARELAAQAARDRAKAGGGPKKGSGGSSGSGGGTITSSAGYFIMPVHGRESSPFGYRYDPFYHRWQLHAGVDIAAPGGTPIRAGAAGRVIRAGWAGGYGNYTCIDNGLYHGKGIATCYAHQSRILVRVGQHVARGQVIGRVGETGAATGYHLHFEVRINGRPVQPVPWLPHCWC